MKKIKDEFFSLSLARQLLILLGTIALFILLIINPFINSRLNNIIETQIYQSITSQQDQLIDMIENVDDWMTQDRFYLGNQLNGDMKVKHLYLLFLDNGMRLEMLSDTPSREGIYLYENLFQNAIVDMNTNNEEEFFDYAELTNGMNLYYKITRSSNFDDLYWISFEMSEISNELLQDVREQLINVLYIVIFIVALVLTVWIYTIIKPLKEISKHIQEIKQSNTSTLELNRNDEIGEVGEALIDMEKELNLQKQLQADLIHNISHDLKTPITIIRSYSESMKDDIYPYGDKNSSLDIIIENTERLEKKVKDFLFLNRLDYLKEKPNTNQMCDIKALIKDIIVELQPLATNISFDLNLDEISFVGESEHWRSCITNILENALRYASSVIQIRLNDDSLSIYNDGQPIESSILKDLFKPYTKGAKGNYGLGMSIAHKIVSMYGYSIEASNFENGVEFKIKKNN